MLIPLQPASVPGITPVEVADFGSNCLRARINILSVMVYLRASSRFKAARVVLALFADAQRPSAPFPMLHGLPL
jgi:hypothetical protein